MPVDYYDGGRRLLENAEKARMGTMGEWADAEKALNIFLRANAQALLNPWRPIEEAERSRVARAIYAIHPLQKQIAPGKWENIPFDETEGAQAVAMLQASAAISAIRRGWCALDQDNSKC